MPEISQEELDALRERIELAETRADEYRAVAEERARELRQAGIEDKLAEYATKFGGQPALMKVVRDVLLSDDGGTALLLSEEGAGQEVERLSATEIVDRVLETLEAPRVDLSEDPMHKFVPGDEKHPVDRDKTPSLDDRVSSARDYLGV